MIIIGSSAIKHWFPDFPREPKDLDIILNQDEKILKETSTRIEILKNPIFENHSYPNNIMDADDLLTLKASHLCWDIKWEKHMFDCQFLLKKGCKIKYDLWKKLYYFWNEYHSKNKRSKLDQSKKDFFDNAINYDEYEHDYIHTLLNPTPVYTLVLKDGCEVELDENKFYKLNYNQKINFVREEVMVMAFERFKKIDYRKAYSLMLKKFIINHAPIWTISFIIENYLLLHKIHFNFIEYIQNKLN